LCVSRNCSSIQFTSVGFKRDVDDDDEQQRRDGHRDVDQPGDEGIDLAAQITGQRAEHRADDEAEDGHREGNEHGGARAVDHAAQHVAPEVIGAEPVRGRRELITGFQILRQEVVRRDVRADRRNEQEKHDDDHAHHRQAIGDQPVERVLEQAVLLFRFCHYCRHYSSPFFFDAARGSSSG
jgi:hypothetical protein